jgi:hypothetical protein
MMTVFKIIIAWPPIMDIGCPVVIAVAIPEAMLLPTDECQYTTA